MPKDYFPSKDPQLVNWLKRLIEILGTQGAQYGLTPAEIANAQNECADMIAKLEDFFEARTTYRSKKRAVTDGKTNTLPRLRKTINRMKAHTMFSTDTARTLNLATQMYKPDDDYMPEFRLQDWGDHVKVYFKKRGVTAMQIFGRLQGEKEFKPLAFRTRSPYIDNRPLAQPGVPEVREYMLVGYVNDVQVGKVSNVKQVVYGGTRFVGA